MDPQNSAPSDLPPPQIPEHPFTDVPGLKTNIPPKSARHFKKLLPFLFLLGFLPIVTGAVLYRQYLSGSASNLPWLCRQKIAVIRINPGKIIPSWVAVRPKCPH
jgi:hypothetical protein